jgi:hypothetical protein
VSVESPTEARLLKDSEVSVEDAEALGEENELKLVKEFERLPRSFAFSSKNSNNEVISVTFWEF